MGIKEINFDNIDMSKYQKEIDEINKLVEDLENDKKIQRLLKKFERKNNEDVKLHIKT